MSKQTIIDYIFIDFALVFQENVMLGSCNLTVIIMTIEIYQNEKEAKG